MYMTNTMYAAAPLPLSHIVGPLEIYLVGARDGKIGSHKVFLTFHTAFGAEPMGGDIG